MAAAYGRLPLRVINELNGEAHIVVNELAAENIAGFGENLALLAAQDDGLKSFNAKNVTMMVGDCLKLPELTGNDIGTFDVIVADNLIHFFDGEQILNFLSVYYAKLKPGGKLFLFFQGRAPSYTLEEVKAIQNEAVLFVNAIHNISCCAEAYNDKILFPGFICDSWLLGKNDVLTHLLQKKPNKSEQSNFIHFESIERLAKALGYGIVSTDFYALVQLDKGVGFIREANEVHSVSIILQKPIDAHSADPRPELDPDLVFSCVSAAQLMKDFIEGDGNLTFIKPFPFVQKGPNFCQNASCLKKGVSNCARCKETKYCLKDCQVGDWQRHKLICQIKKLN